LVPSSSYELAPFVLVRVGALGLVRVGTIATLGLATRVIAATVDLAI